jgi:DDE superfamily endonuclease
VFAYGVELRIDATETQVRRPQAHRVGRRAFVSGKRKQNTIKLTTCGDAAGQTLWTGAARPGRMHDQTAVKTEGVCDLLAQHPTVKVHVDEGYRGLATAFPDQVCTPPRKPPKDATAEPLARYERARRR